MTKEEFKQFLNANKAIIQQTTPTKKSISSSDEWAKETEWDKVYHDIKEEKCKDLKLAKCGL